MSLFTITPTPPTTLKIKPGQQDKLSFTVTSLAAPDKTHEVILQATLVEAGGARKEVDWLVPGPARKLTLKGGKTETVTIAVKPSASMPKGQYPIQLVVANSQNPNEEFDVSPPAACEVLASEGPKPSPPRPKWLIPAIVGAVVLVGGGVTAIILLSGGDDESKKKTAGLHQPCAEKGDPCPGKLVCDRETSKCLLASGANCKDSADCASGACNEKDKACAVATGERCDPDQKDAVSCVQGAHCDADKKKCLAKNGTACSSDQQCESENCAQKVCAEEGPQAEGRPCKGHAHCKSGLCEEGRCASLGLGRNCTADGMCAPDQKCTPVQPGTKNCYSQPGKTCKADGECSSGWCKGGACSRDDGVCKDPSDCQPGTVCDPRSHACLLPIGALCGGADHCSSHFCSNDRCLANPCPGACSSCDPVRRVCLAVKTHVAIATRYQNSSETLRASVLRAQPAGAR